jgi:hypothetical protein
MTWCAASVVMLAFVNVCAIAVSLRGLIGRGGD